MTGYPFIAGADSDPDDVIDHPEPTAQGLYRDIEGDYWVHRSDGGWVLTYWVDKSPEQDANFLPPTITDPTADYPFQRQRLWLDISQKFKPFDHIMPYPGI